MATKVRAAQKAVTEAQQRLEQVASGVGPTLQEHLKNANDESAEPKPADSQKETVSVQQAQQGLDMARQEHEPMARQREQVRQSIRGIGQAYHFVDFERGVRRNGGLIAADIQQQLDQIRAIAEQEGLSQPRLEQFCKAERVIPKMQATIEFVSGYVRQQVDQLDLTPSASHALHALLIPSSYLDRVAQTRSVAAGEPLHELAERLRAPLFELGGALYSLSRDVQDQLHQKAKTLADVFQRSSSNVEGRNGYFHCATIDFEGLICLASASASPLATTFSLLGLTERRRPSDFSTRSPGSCLPRFWTRWNCHLLLSVHLGEHKVADPLIEADKGLADFMSFRFCLIDKSVNRLIILNVYITDKKANAM